MGKPCSYHGVSLQSVNITGIPYNIYNISLKEYGGFRPPEALETKLITLGT